MAFFKQTWTLASKNFRIVLLRHSIATFIRAFILPIALMVFLAFAKNLSFHPRFTALVPPFLCCPSRMDWRLSSNTGRDTVAFVHNGFPGGEIERVINELAPVVTAAGRRPPSYRTGQSFSRYAGPLCAASPLATGPFCSMHRRAKAKVGCGITLSVRTVRSAAAGSMSRRQPTTARYTCFHSSMQSMRPSRVPITALQIISRCHPQVRIKTGHLSLTSYLLSFLSSACPSNSRLQKSCRVSGSYQCHISLPHHISPCSFAHNSRYCIC